MILISNQSIMDIEFIEYLVIEVTRKCNMQCSHCLRGEPQALNMNMPMIVEFAKKFKGGQIGTINFTGGEPTLAYRVIDSVIQIFKEWDITCQNFYIATNGKVIPEGFIMTCVELWKYCDENEISSVDLSNDMRHDEDGEPPDFHKLSLFSFAKNKYEKDGYRYDPIAEGRYEGMGERVVSGGCRYEDKSLVDGEIYINVFGDIIDGCNYSYETQKSKKICSVKDDFISILLNKYAV